MNSVSRICISIIFLMTPILSAESDEFPTLNVLPLCRGIISQGADPLQAGDPRVSIDECLKAEKQDRETMIQEWPTFSASETLHCHGERRQEDATGAGEFKADRLTGEKSVRSLSRQVLAPFLSCKGFFCIEDAQALIHETRQVTGGLLIVRYQLCCSA
jgi:hypothetical protein